MKTKALIALGFALVTFTSGCGRKEGSQTTPKGAMTMFIDGFSKLDKSRVMACVTGGEQELKALSVFIDYAIAVKDFQKAIIDQYGASGWAHFENEGGAKLSLDLTGDKNKLDSAKIEVDGNRATCTVPGDAQVMKLLRKDGLWYVDAGSALASGGTDAGEFIRLWSAMTHLIRKKQQRIGQPGVTPQSLDMELGKELLGVMTRDGQGIRFDSQ